MNKKRNGKLKRLCPVLLFWYNTFGCILMKEIEILVEVYSPVDEVIRALEKFSYEGIKETIDVYYYDPMRHNLKPDSKGQIDECLRVRTKDNKNYITYKVDKFDNGTWLYSDEYETEVDNIFMVTEILKRLGLKELLTIHNSKRTYKTDSYEIVFETVKDLGYFLEVEYCTNEDVDVGLIKDQIQEFIDSLGIKVSSELNMGKPEMMIKKFKIEVWNDRYNYAGL